LTADEWAAVAWRELRMYLDLVVPTRDSKGNTALLAFLVEQDWSCAAALRRAQIFGANSTATPAHRKQKDRLQAARTIPPSHSGRQASSRHLCCHKESAVASRLPNLAGGEPAARHRRGLCVSETSLSAPPTELQLNQRACRQSCDRACGMAAELALASSGMTRPFPCAIFLAYSN